MRLTDGPSRNSGRLQFLNPAPKTGWQDYCDYPNQRNIQVMCRMLGYDSDIDRIVFSGKKIVAIASQ